jgi:hypothetical protein
MFFTYTTQKKRINNPIIQTSPLLHSFTFETSAIGGGVSNNRNAFSASEIKKEMNMLENGGFRQNMFSRIGKQTECLSCNK